MYIYSIYLIYLNTFFFYGAIDHTDMDVVGRPNKKARRYRRGQVLSQSPNLDSARTCSGHGGQTYLADIVNLCTDKIGKTGLPIGARQTI